MFFKWTSFLKNKQTKHASTIRPRQVVWRDDEVIIDVSGQTCPGYLLAINSAVEPLPPGTRIKLPITYPPAVTTSARGARPKAYNCSTLRTETAASG